jgi:hypothetical protein
MVVSDKVIHASTRYNLRVLETLVAARVLARMLGVRLDDGGKREKITLREVLGRFAGDQDHESSLQPALETILGRLEELKPRTSFPGVTMQEMVTLSGLGESEFTALYLSDVEGESVHV